MARPLRIEFPGAFYHVMNRGSEHRSIFPEGNRHRGLFKKTLGEAVNKWKIIIHAYSLMDNHYHLLVETPLGNISRAMRHIDGVYTQRVNRSLDRDGPLLRGRFKSILVQKESYFLELVRYIHLNGVRAGLYPSPEFDKNGSHRDYLFPRHAPSWLERGTVLSYFQNQNQSPNRALDQFVNMGTSKEVDETFMKKRWPAILGQKEFVEWVKDEVMQDHENPHPEIPQMRVIVQNTLINPKLILKKVSSWYKKNRRESSLNIKEKREKKWISMRFLKEYSQASYQRIGELMGGMSKRSVEKFITRNNFESSQNFKQIRQQLEKMSTVET
ncbi:hypothetical protein BVX98_06655 [bacterium F11]|nr:hypothetical protein BVX98_06655 [bacterium F11]